jgi:16S rRNA (cytosine967-C5)-methyltransferase
LSAPGLAARAAAAALLAGVLERGTRLADLSVPLAGLAAAERARASALAATTLRHLGRIDALLECFLDRPPPAPARHALRLAAAEMLIDGVPPHAAVDAAVRLARGHPKTRHLAGLVNAVARRVAAGGAELWGATPEAGLPGWIAGPVRAAWGDAALAGIEAAHRAGPPPIDLTLRDPGDASGWAERLMAERLPTGSLRVACRRQVSTLPGFAEGAWWVQDAAAALPARLAGPVTGRAALDLCAAPGGKTLQLAAAGATVTAVDHSAPRRERLAENLARTGLTAETFAVDALAWEPARRFDLVLLDAPCTATGTLRRHPDLPFVRREAELPVLVELQARLLARAWEWVTPGGRLVFCTCSLLPAEGEEQVARFLAQRPGARLALPDAAALGIEPHWVDARGGLRLRPDFWAERGGMDGFYAACLERLDAA